MDKDEVGRLQVVATLAKTYKEAFEDYLDYLGLEERLAELEGKYKGLIEKSQTHAPSWFSVLVGFFGRQGGNFANSRNCRSKCGL